jgi:hypothetical protein
VDEQWELPFAHGARPPIREVGGGPTGRMACSSPWYPGYVTLRTLPISTELFKAKSSTMSRARLTGPAWEGTRREPSGLCAVLALPWADGFVAQWFGWTSPLTVRPFTQGSRLANFRVTCCSVLERID